ncbi:MAG: thrombospondin type 3 repeat-containing protein [Candidatus Polarisedimenticolia bacterium]
MPPGLILVDEYFDGGARGVGSDGSTTGIGVVPVGGSVSFDFYRRDGQDQMRASLAWYDADGDTLRNDLDLEVISGDYDLADLGKGVCQTTNLFNPPPQGPFPDFCGFCTYEALDPNGGAAYYDPTGNNPYVKIWRGNQMREFAGQFTLRAECNQDVDEELPCFDDANPGAICSDFDAAPQNEPDSINTTEQVIHHYFGDAGGFGLTRSGGEHGFHRARVRFKSTGSSTPVPDAPAIARGVDGILQTAPAGDDSVLTTGAGVTYIGTGLDGIVQTTANAADVQLIPPGSFGQPFALAIAGPVYNSRMGSTISLNRDVYNCSDRTVTLRVADGSRILANAFQAETTTNIGLRSRIEALDPNGLVRDTEAGLTFLADPGVATFRVGRANHYTSNARRLQFISDRPGATNPISNNGIVEVRSGWTLRAVYDDQSPTSPGGPVPGDAVTVAKVNCAPLLGPVLLFPAGGGVSGDPMRRTLVTGGCDVGRSRGGRGDFYFDAGEAIVYQVGFANQNLDQAINLKATLSCTDPVPGGANPCSFLGPLPQSVELGEIPAGREGIAAWTINVDAGVKTLATADRAVDLVVSFTSRGTDWGDQLAAQTFTFREALQADTETLNYHTDFPAGGTLAADRNRDGRVQTVPPGSEARNLELLTFRPLNDTGTCSAGRCSNISRTCSINTDCDNPNTAIAAQMPWRFDSNAGGFVARRAPDMKGGGGVQNQLAWFYSTGGGCGWQTQNNGVVGSSGTLPKGTWHAGHGPVGIFRAPNACPEYTIPTDPTTAPFVEFVHDLLDSPVMQRVNTAPDARGIPFDIRMETVGWNETQELIDTSSFTQIEVDSNIDDGGPVTLGDSYSYQTPSPGTMAGPKTSAANQQRTFGPLRDSNGSLATKTGVSGDEVGVAEPIIQRSETNVNERLLMAFPVADVDGNTPGFQENTAVDPNTGLPIVPGVCTGGVCSAGGDALIGMPCVTHAQCTGPGTLIGHSTAWGPVRNREIDLPAERFEELRGASGNRFQFELSWWLLEGGTGGGLGWTIDDAYFHWSERHPMDQSDTGINDCASIPSRLGANPAARQCGTITWERLTTHNCTTGIKVTVTDATPAPAPAGTCTAGRCVAGLSSRVGTSCATNADCTCAPGEVAIDARSTTEPLGEAFCLAPQGGGIFSGVVQLSAVVDQKGILNVNATQGENFNIVASYADPECDQDGDGELAENNFRDVDGDGVPNFGADAVSNDISSTDFLAQGQGSSDDDNCFDDVSLLDVFNPANTAQRDNNGSGTITAADCAPSPRNGQCDWDDDGHGDLCDNCPLAANNDQLDTDGDGVGNACEVVDIDGDGDLNSADNCPTLYNPSQAGGVRGTFCDDFGDFDGDLVDEVNDNCPNEGVVQSPGPPAPSFAATYNADQLDNDGDGIGDKCDSEDFDNDLVPNFVDSCPTFYNPADPTFHVQTDSDLDPKPVNRRYGTGDDRKGIDIIPGVANYCDPDSDDDDLSGIPDDLLQVASELSCEHSRSGTTNMASTPVSVGSITLAAVALTDDGSSDFFCTSGDPEPNNNPGLPQPCPQEGPGSPNNDAFCNTPPAGTDGICASVPDGVADPGELASVMLTLTNTSVDKLGASIPLNNLTVGIRPLTPSVGCTPKAQVFMGNMGAGAVGVQTPAGALNFIIDPANPGPGRSSLAKLAEAEFALTATADGIEGVPEKTFKFTVDMDRVEWPRIPANCPSIPASPVGTLCEDFDTNRNGVPGLQFSRLPISTTPGDILRANGDPDDDILGYTMDTGASPTGTDGRICTDDNGGFIGCQAPVYEENDWHLHSAFEYPGAAYDVGGLGPGIGAPDGGKAHSGVRSLHMGRHLSATSTLVDTLRLRQVSAFVLDSQGDPSIPGVVPGPTSTLEFWQIISVPDEENFGSGFFCCSFGGGQVHVSLLGSDGRFERWQRLTPNFNGYDSRIQETISICGFDPGDDQIAPANETMCNFSPLYADKGDVFGTDTTCMTDTDNNDYQHKDCGDITCTPGPGCTESSSTPGAGVWTRTAFDLSGFSGRVARLRWIGMVEGGWSFATQRSAMEPDPGGIAYQYYDGDDGWYVDDIRLTDLRQQPSLTAPDNVTGLSQCTTGQATGNCGAVSISVAGSVAFGSRRLIGLDSLLQPVPLDARGSTAGNDPNTPAAEGACDNGVLQFQWEQLDLVTSSVVDVISPFSPQGIVQVAPSRDTLYRVTARCSSDLTCLGQQDVVVKTYTGDGSDLGPQAALNTAGVTTEVGLDVIGGATATLRWPARTQPPGISGYDVFRFTYAAATTGTDVFSGNTFDGDCFANAVAQTPLGTLTSLNDASTPAVGTSYFYQVGHSSTNALAVAPLGVQPPSATTRPGQLVTAGVTCP